MHTGTRANKRERIQNITRKKQKFVCKREQHWRFVGKCLDWKEDLAHGRLLTVFLNVWKRKLNYCNRFSVGRKLILG